MKENKLTIARIAMVVCILLASVFGSYRSMSRLVQNTTAVFYLGVGGDGLSIEHDLNERINLAFNLTTIARSYVSDGSIEPVLAARQALMDAKSIPEKYQANLKLTETTTKLLTLLEEYSLSTKHEEYRERIAFDLRSRNSTISHDGYNEAAEKANATLRGIPVRWLRILVGMEDVPLFR